MKINKELTEEMNLGEDYIRSLKDKMAACWLRYDEAMKNGEDAELSWDYYEAEMTLKELGF